MALFRENSPLKHLVWHVLTKDYTVLPATHTFIHEWNQLSCLYSQPHFGQYSFPVPQRVERVGG